MTIFADFARRAALAALVSFTALPALAIDGPGNFAPGGDGPDEPGPGNWGGPGGFAANPEGPGPGNPTGNPMPQGGEGFIANTSNDGCPNGVLVVEFEVDADGHMIPSTIERDCRILYR